MNRFFLLLFITTACTMHAFSQEKNLSNITKLTFGGDNAEAYFSPDGNMLTMQVAFDKIGAHCDQIFLLNLQKESFSTNDLKLVSTGKGRTTCSYFMSDGKHVLYASTHGAYDTCPPLPKARKDGKYVWPIYPDFDIYVADLNGKVVKQLTNSPGYDAEAVVSPDGKKIVFTSIRSGDLELWTMDIDGSNLKQITFGLGYDGGAFFSHDSKKLVFRSSRPKTAEEIKEYKNLLAENLVAPTDMEIYTCNVDGSNIQQITHLGKANWSPFFHPSDKKIIFSSNHHSTKGYDFQLYTIDIDGSNLQQITYQSNFNAFPMFSPDGKRLVFSSNRQPDAPRETDVFIADWIETNPAEICKVDNLKKSIVYLASDKLKGRLSGSKGALAAAKYIAEEYKNIGLQPYVGNSFLHPFTYKHNSNPHSADSLKSKVITSSNVVGFLDNKSEKTIVIGAHYDHLGLNEHHNSTLPNSKGQIHNGADDNASGVAAVLELARMFAHNQRLENVNYLFVCFSGEEDGLMGSKEIADMLKKQNLPIVAMVNMDMVGRLDSLKNLIIQGVGTSDNFQSLVTAFKPAGFNLSFDSSGVGPSDYTSFYLKNIPVLNFFTGTHKDYHKPSDDADKINYIGEKIIVDYMFRVIDSLSNQVEIPFIKTKMTTGKTVAKYKVTMGIMPDYKDYGDGMHIEAVIDGRPAQKAGLKDGDILLKLGDCNIKEVYSYMECLSKFKEGDETTVIFKRDGLEKKSLIKF